MADETGIPLEQFLASRAGLSRGAALQQGFQQIAGPVTSALAPVAGTLAEPLVAGYRALTGQPTTPATSLRELSESGRPIAEAIVPQTPLDLAVLLGTGGAGALAARAGVTGLKAAGARIAGGALGGGLGAAAQGSDTLLGAAQGAAGATAGEVIGKGIDVARGIGAQRVAAKIQAMDAKNFGAAVAEIEPLFGKRTTADSLYALVTPDAITGKVPGLHILDQAQKQATQKIEQILEQAPTLGGFGGRGNVLFPDPKDPAHFIPFAEARKNLSDLFDRGFGGAKGQPLDPTIKGADYKKLYREGVEALQKTLDTHDPTGTARQLFDAAREQYRVGRGLLQLVEKAFQSFAPNRLQFNSDALQTMLSKPKSAAKMAVKLGPDNFALIQDALFNGVGPGHVHDFAPASSLGRLTETLPLPGNLRAYARERVTMPQLVGDPLKLGAFGRTATDLGAEAGLGAALGQGLPIVGRGQ